MTSDFSFCLKKNWTSNQEGGTRVVWSGYPTIHSLPNVAGSAADRSTFFLLNGVVVVVVVGDGPRAHSTSTSRRAAGRDDCRLFQNKKWSSNQEGAPRVRRSGLRTIHALPDVAISAADRSIFYLPNGVVGDGPHVHFTQSRDDRRFWFKKNELRIKKAGLWCLGAGF